MATHTNSEGDSFDEESGKLIKAIDKMLDECPPSPAVAEEIELEGGKYKLVSISGRMCALRHGEPWRELTGDKMVGAMFCEIRALRALLVHRNAAIEEAREQGRNEERDRAGLT